MKVDERREKMEEQLVVIEEARMQQPQRQNHNDFDAAIVSGSDINGPNDDSDSSDFDQPPKTLKDLPEMGEDSDMDEGSVQHQSNIPPPDKLYNPNKDDEDEAWVYKHLRGGVEEPISITSHQYNNQDSTNPAASNVKGSVPSLSQQVLKPRSSDAVISCPCCFQIVCMDCQRHERYANQFRAMFVMNIEVHWHLTLEPETMGAKAKEDSNNSQNDMNRKKLRKTKDSSTVTSIPPDITHDGPSNLDDAGNSTEKELYYSVHCNSCKTQVAALNMTDEVYHFFGCLVSA